MTAPNPTNGRHAVLQTDLVDSTRLADELGDVAMSKIWQKHDRAARDLLHVWHGREIDKSDGFLLLFDTVSNAIAYALAYHQALRSLGVALKARAGLHVGPVTCRPNTETDVAAGAKPLEVTGIAVPIAARVMSLALAGQTLLTSEAKAALGATVLRLESHGHWRLKGMREPFELFEVGDEAAPFAPPHDSFKCYRVLRRNDLWVPISQVRHSLPAERDAFVGREAALQELRRKLDAGARLISVMGIGGSGKTRLAQRFGWIWLGEFPGGVWFCDLSQARDLDGIVRAVAQGLDVPLGQNDPIAQLGNAIAARGRCVVILDNVEQVARHAEETVGKWLDRAAEAQFIVTTREVLNIPGEETLALAPLTLDEGARLFLKRASAAKAEFMQKGEDEAAINPLVKLLDGLPLAIELAAARVRVMPPRILLQRMSERFQLLASTGGRRDRQATLRATFDWSWDLLSPAEKAALAQLSVFEGGFSLAAAEAVLDLAGFDNAPLHIDMVQSLVEKSLVHPIGDVRFDLLSSIKEYASEQLMTAGRFPGAGSEAMLRAQARHWDYFSRLSEREATADRCIEIDNLACACRRAAASGDVRAAVGALAGAWAGLKLSGPFRAAIELSEVVRGMTQVGTKDSPVIEWVAGSAHYLIGNASKAQEYFEKGLAQSRNVGDEHGEARMLCALADFRTTSGRLQQAREDLERALVLARRLGDRSLEFRALNGLGTLCGDQALLRDAHMFYRAALLLARQLGDERWEGGLLGNLGSLYHNSGRLNDAREHYEQALRLAITTGDRQWEGNARCNLGLLQHEQGCETEARSCLEGALAMAQEMGHARLACTVLCNLGIVTEAQGDFETALVHYEKAVAATQVLGDCRSEGQFRGYLGLLYARIGRFSDARDCLAAGEVLLEAISDPLSLGLLLCSRANVEHLAGEVGHALTTVEKVEGLALSIGASGESELGRALTKLRNDLNEARETP